jgi:hypothetical protein
MDTAGRPVCFRQRLPLNAGPQHIKDGFQYPARRYRLPPGTGFSLISLVFLPFPLGDEIPDPLPQFFRQFP